MFFANTGGILRGRRAEPAKTGPDISKARVVEQDYGRTGTWKPKYPEFESDYSTRDLYRLPEDRTFEQPDVQSGNEPEWVQAPSYSHVDSFRFFDARQRGVVIRGGTTIGNSRIQVRFKPTKTRPMTEYDYVFDDAVVAESVFNMLVNAAHPGEIVDSVLIANKVPYMRRS